MRILVFTNTPAHVHLYRNAVTELRARGHDVLVLARDYGCTVELLEWYDVPFEVYGYCDTSKGSLFRNLPSHYSQILRRAVEFGPDLVFGMGGYAAHTGVLTRADTVLILDSETTTLDHAVSRPFADVILTPDSFQADLGPKHYTFRGFKETAYLHPDEFERQADIRDALGVEADDTYVIVRFNAFGSHHDVGEQGFTPEQRARLIRELAQEATVFVSDEGDSMDLDDLPARPFDVPAALMHDAIAEAALVVTDTQTVATEAALLGTPVVRSNSFVGEGDMGNFVELEDAGLIRNTSEFEQALAAAVELLRDDTAADRWQRRRESYVESTVNLTELIVETALSMGAPERISEVSKRTGQSGLGATGIGDSSGQPVAED